MNPTTLAPLTPKTNAEWVLLFAGLTLDLIKPYRDQTGLQLPEDVIEFDRGLRGVFSETREESALPQALLNWALLNYGRPFVLYLSQWKTNVFKPDPDESFQAFVWRLLIVRGGLSGERDVQPPPPFVVSVRFALAQFPSPAISPVPQSPWDRALFERFGYDDSSNPVTYFTAAVSRYGFVRAWEAARQSNTRYDPVELKAWARREAEVKRMPIDQVKNPVWPPLPASWR